MKKMSRLEEQARIFQTLTLPDECMEGRTVPGRGMFTKEVFNRLFDHYVKNLPGGVWCVWRIEYKRRLSGVLKGEHVPHLHILLGGWFGVNETNLHSLCLGVASRWCDLLGLVGRDLEKAKSSNMHARSFEIIKSWRHSLRYVCKYIAKDDELALPGVGRFWGFCGPCPVARLPRQYLLRLKEGVQYKRFLCRYVRSKGQRKLARYWMRHRCNFTCFIPRCVVLRFLRGLIGDDYPEEYSESIKKAYGMKGAYA